METLWPKHLCHAAGPDGHQTKVAVVDDDDYSLVGVHLATDEGVAVTNCLL